MLTGFESIFGDIEACDEGLPAAWGQEACEHFHCGAFASTVGTEKGAHLTSGDCKADVAGGGEVAVELAEPAGFDHEFAG